MFGRVRRFLQRNFGNIALGVLALPLFYRLTRFTAKQYLTYRNQRAHELIKQYKKQQMFEMMEENFEKTFRTWFELMQKSIQERLNAERIADQLKTGDGDKLENWRELKIVAFSRILSYVYGSSMLTILLRVQTNVISGLLFKQLEETPKNLDILRGPGDRGGGGDATTVTAEYSKRKFVTDEIQEDYMILTRHLCTEGVTALCDLMKEKSRRIVENLSLKQKLTVGDMEQLLTAIRNKEVNDILELSDWCPITEAWNYMFSEESKIQFLYPNPAYHRTCWASERQEFLRLLVGEAFDLVNAEDSRTILKFLESQGINYYLDRISDFINTVPQADSDSSQSSDGPSAPDQTTLDVDEKHAAVAKLIPIMNSFINVPYTDDVWATLLLRNESLKLFSANIYESYSSKKFN